MISLFHQPVPTAKPTPVIPTLSKHVITLGFKGPFEQGGGGGGRVLGSGTPEEVAACVESHTGRFLKPLLSLSAAAA